MSDGQRKHVLSFSAIERRHGANDLDITWRLTVLSNRRFRIHEMGIGGVFMLLGVALFCFAAYSIDAHRLTLQLAEEVEEGMPTDVLAMTAIATLLCFMGSYFLSGELKPITIVKGTHTMELYAFRRDFLSFNTRSCAIPITTPSIH